MDDTPRASDIPWAPPPKRYRVGEIVRHTGFSRQTIHNYTTMGLIRERERTGAGHRLYGEEVFQTLALIKTLRGSKTLSEIHDILQAEGLIDDSGSRDFPSESPTL